MKKLFKCIGIIILILLIAAIVLPIAFKGKIIQAIKDGANKNMNAKLFKFEGKTNEANTNQDFETVRKCLVQLEMYNHLLLNFKDRSSKHLKNCLDNVKKEI